MVGKTENEKNDLKKESVKADAGIVNELIYLAHMQDQEAIGLLFRQFRPIIRIVYHRFGLTPSLLTMDDWENEAYELIALLVELYREDSKAAFGTCLYRYLENRARSFKRVKAYKKTIPEKMMVSIDEVMEDGSKFEWERYAYHYSIQFEPELMVSETLDSVLNQLDPLMTEKEMKVLDLIRNGYRPREVARKLAITHQQVHGIVRKAGKKWRDIERKTSAIP